MITSPMLAVKAENIDELIYPIYCTPKLDGIRCLKPKDVTVTRTFKLIPNRYIRKILSEILPIGADGEIIIGETFQECTSGVMSFEGEPKFTYYMFDYVKDSIKDSYLKRMKDLYEWWLTKEKYSNIIIPLFPEKINNLGELKDFEETCLDKGFEGVIIRSGDGPYKCGRSTWKQKHLLKLKRFTDSEAIIIGFEELYHNDNPQEKDNFGRSKRSSSKENLRPAGVLGKFLVKDYYTGVEFKVGSGFSAYDRKKFWNEKESLLGKIITYTFFTVGVKNKPRHGIYKGFRAKEDM